VRNGQASQGNLYARQLIRCSNLYASQQAWLRLIHINLLCAATAVVVWCCVWEACQRVLELLLAGFYCCFGSCYVKGGFAM